MTKGGEGDRRGLLVLSAAALGDALQPFLRVMEEIYVGWRGVGRSNVGRPHPASSSTVDDLSNSAALHFHFHPEQPEERGGARIFTSPLRIDDIRCWLGKIRAPIRSITTWPWPSSSDIKA